MNRYIYILLFVVGIIGFYSTGFITPAFAGNGNGINCEELLLGPMPPQGCEWVYKCENNINLNDDIQPLWTFVFYNDGNFKVDWTQAAFGPPGPFPTATLRCQCKPTGSFNNPNFDASNVLHCAGALNRVRDFAIEGNVVANGGAIIQGNILNEQGVYWVYECERVLDCPASCDPGSVFCPGAGCFDLNTDENNCGACGNACAAYEGCGAGVCRLNNGSSCSTGTDCLSGNCVFGTCCPTSIGCNYADCGSGPTDLWTDPNNCGTCGNACPCGYLGECQGAICIDPPGGVCP